MLLVFGAPCQLRLLAGPEHGRTIPLADIDGLDIPQCSAWAIVALKMSLIQSPPKLPSESNPADFKNFLKAPSSLFDFGVDKAVVYARGATACASQRALAMSGFR